MHQKRTQETRKFIEGTIRLTSRGVGYVSEEGADGEIEIPLELLNTALDRDRVQVALHPYPRVSRVLVRAREDFVGVLNKERGMFTVTADDYRMYTAIAVHKDKLHGANPGDKVFVTMLPWTNAKKMPEGTIREVLGKPGVHETEMRAIVRDKGFDLRFPAAAEEEAAHLRREYRTIPDDEIRNRRDMRNAALFTIDPEDAKDFDDALSIQKLPDGAVEVGVHIADVAFFVREGSVLDREAAERGTSVYLVDRTIPMLPEVLSNDLCSLNPGEDKLAFSALFELSPRGEIEKRWFGRTIINSKKRFTYEEAQTVLDTKRGPFAEELALLSKLAQIFRKKRFEAGALSFEHPEVKFILDKEGRPVRIVQKLRQETNKLVEDLMVLANSEVARYATGRDPSVERTFVYRVHDVPGEDKARELTNLMGALGFAMPKGANLSSAKGIQTLLQKIEGSAHEGIINLAAVQSMEKAIYSTKNIGHFGLSLKHYTHFTSPIRRYPDIMVHRLLAHYLSGKRVAPKKWEEYEALSRYATQMEIAAQDAEWASIKYKHIEYMMSRKQETFEGVITGLTERGMFVREKQTLAEGMVRYRDIGGDYYVYDERTRSARGERRKKTYRLGDTVRMQVLNANLDKKFLDWKLV